MSSNKSQHRVIRLPLAGHHGLFVTRGSSARDEGLSAMHGGIKNAANGMVTIDIERESFVAETWRLNGQRCFGAT
jgi:hypothetical protein